jgi:predicted 2-oxoglutarate/Fe(II)-dependent dioxygenase YbiX
MIALIFIIILVAYLLPTYPKPVIIENFMTDEERIHIMTEAKSKLKVSTVAKDRTVDESIRKSETAWLSLDDPVVRGVVERCVQRTDRPLENCEQLQVLKYKPGGFYTPHQDAFMDDKNKRMYTFVLALNDDYEGGETAFPNLEEKYTMRAGDALFFNTLDNYELDTSKALHGGEPVKNGEKWICNLWVRKYPYIINHPI